MNHAQRSRGRSPSVPLQAIQGQGWFSSLFSRQLDLDVVVLSDDWLRESGIQQQLEFEGFQLRWANTARLKSNFDDGWMFATLSHYLWWRRRIRRRHGVETQYLLKRVKSFRS